MAELQYTPTANADQTHSVARTTGTAVLAGASAVIIVDNTRTKIQVWDSIRAAIRAIRRDSGKATKPAQFPTATTTLE